MKKVLAAIILFVLALAGASFYWWNLAVKPVSSSGESKDFLIAKGSSASQIGNKLAQAGLIKSPFGFKSYVKITGKAGKIQAGEYALSPSLSLFQIVDELLRGPKEIWVTIPEGFRSEEIAEKFATGLFKEDKETFIDEFLESSLGKEGYLFPDTYIFPKEVSASVVVKKLLGTFETRVNPQMEADIVSSGYSRNQILTMASVVERETITQDERPIVAGILYKRLKAGWPLQADATLQYILGNTRCKMQKVDCKWWEVPEVEDRKINSAYNTYKNLGLPPGPIASPGLSAINAAIYPESSDYWYYLHDERGKIYYAQTLIEHNENISKYLKN